MWNYGRFMIALAPFGIIYVICTLLIPADTSKVRTWRLHFFEIRVRFFALSLALLAVMVLATIVLLDHPIFHLRRIIPSALGATFVAGMISEHPKLHATIALTTAALCVVIAVVFARPTTFGVAP